MRHVFNCYTPFTLPLLNNIGTDYRPVMFDHGVNIFLDFICHPVHWYLLIYCFRLLRLSTVEILQKAAGHTSDQCMTDILFDLCYRLKLMVNSDGSPWPRP